MKLTDKDLRVMRRALSYANRNLLEDYGMMKDSPDKVANVITDNTQLSRKIVKFIKGDDER